MTKFARVYRPLRFYVSRVIAALKADLTLYPRGPHRRHDPRSAFKCRGERFLYEDVFARLGGPHN